MMTRHMLTTRCRQETGAQAVEFALILPVLLLIILGLIDFGWAFGQKLSLNQAVREGARKAVVSQSATSTDIANFVKSSTGGLVSPTSDIKVTTDIQVETLTGFDVFTTAGNKACSDYTKMGGQLRVTAVYPDPNVRQPGWLVYLPVPVAAPLLTSMAVFRCEVI